MSDSTTYIKRGFHVVHTGAIGLALATKDDLPVGNVRVESYEQASPEQPKSNIWIENLGTLVSIYPRTVSRTPAVNNFIVGFDGLLNTVYTIKVCVTEKVAMAYLSYVLWPYAESQQASAFSQKNTLSDNSAHTRATDCRRYSMLAATLRRRSWDMHAGPGERQWRRIQMHLRRGVYRCDHVLALFSTWPCWYNLISSLQVLSTSYSVSCC
jgi:hypothetical protein